MSEETHLLTITLAMEDGTLVKSVSHSSQGTVHSRIPFDLPALQAQWQGLSRDVENYRSRHATPTAIQASDATIYQKSAREIGKALFRAIFTDEGDFQESYALFRNLSPKRAREKHLLLQLQCDDLQLQALPWELLHHEDRFLALDKRFSLVRYIEQNTSKAVLDVPTPLRVLFVAANPQDCNQLELEHEYRELQNLLRDAEINGIIELDHLFHATLPKLQEKLAENYYHVLHFAGHASHEGYLLFEDSKHQSKRSLPKI